MLLSELVYQSIKNVIYYDDASFTYESFLEGSYDNDTDYAMSINNAFTPLNMALAILNNKEKIPHKIAFVSNDKLTSGYILDKSDIDNECEQVINVGIQSGKDYRKISHRVFGNKKIMLLMPQFVSGDLMVEYKGKLPLFNKSMLKPIEVGEYGDAVDENIDLEQYGISNEMCLYIMEFVKGNLLEPIQPEIANMHVSRFYSYIDVLPSNEYIFNQNVVEKKNKIGE